MNRGHVALYLTCLNPVLRAMVQLKCLVPAQEGPSLQLLTLSLKQENWSSLNAYLQADDRSHRNYEQSDNANWRRNV